MNIISLLGTLVVLGLVFWLLWWLLGQLPLAEPFRTAANVILALASVALLLSILFGGVSVPGLHLR